MTFACEVQMYPLKQVNNKKADTLKDSLKWEQGGERLLPAVQSFASKAESKLWLGPLKSPALYTHWAVTGFDKRLIHFSTH